MRLLVSFKLVCVSFSCIWHSVSAHYMSDVLFGGTAGFISALIGFIIVKISYKKLNKNILS